MIKLLKDAKYQHEVKNLNNSGFQKNLNLEFNPRLHNLNENINNFHRLEELSIEINNACPLRCLYCSSNGGEHPEEKIKFEDLKKIIVSAKKLGTKRIVLTGGEPFLYENLIPLCKFIKKNQFQLYIYTCGNIYSKSGHITQISKSLIKDLSNIKIDKIIFNIQSSNPKIHDKITKQEDSYNNAKKSLKFSTKFKIRTEIHFVPMKINYLEIKNIFETYKNRVNRINILRFVSQGRGKLNEKKLKLLKEDEIKLRNLLRDIISTYSFYRIGAPFNNLLSRRIPCTLGLNKLVIRSNGQIFPCDGLKNFGNGSNFHHIDSIFYNPNNLSKIWNYSIFLKIIRNLNKLDICESCPEICEIRNECIAQKFNNCKIFSNKE